MPCYNSSEFLPDLVKSVVRQTYADWEMILVDDGSTDDTPRLCAAFAERYAHIRVITQTNQGVSAARNIGLQAAKGEYISFVDSDDVWPAYHLEILHTLLTRNDADIAAGAHLEFRTSKQLLRLLRNESHINPDTQQTKILSGSEAAELSLYQTGLDCSLWGKLFRHELFDGITFSVGEIYEDLGAFHLLAMKARRVAVTDIPVYYYRIHPHSLTHSFNAQRLVVLDVTKRIEDYVADNSPQLLAAANDRRLSANFNMLGLMLASGDNEHYRDEIKRCRRIITQYRRDSLRNPKVRRKNKAGILLSYLPDAIYHYVLKRHYRQKHRQKH